MGTIKCGFWTSRFLLSPDEFYEWIDLWYQQGFTIQAVNLPANIKQQYKNFYDSRMDMSKCNLQIPFVCYSLEKEAFQSGFHLISKEFSFYPQGKGTVRSELFLELSTPKQFAVPTEDGKYFTYEDILQKEPQAQDIFNSFHSLIKRITKPLYYMERPAYSIRISKSAYADLLNSAFIKNIGMGLGSKW